MEREHYKITVEAEDQPTAGSSALALADSLQEAEGVLEAKRSKADDDATMDLGAIVTVIATSGATLAIAQGIAAWLRARRGVKVTIERDGKTGSVKKIIEGIDPASAVRVLELDRKG